jgi:predicted ATPase
VINFLKIENFKCFQDASFVLRPLTILTGVNGGGKSTVLQSLLLARLASTTPPGRAIRLNGPYGLALGSARDVLSWAAPEPTVGVYLSDTTVGQEWQFRLDVPEEEGALHLGVESVPMTPVPGIGTSPVGFTYLCAERLGPRDLLSVSAREPDEIGVGIQGEFTAQVLALRETRAVSARETVREVLWHPDTRSPLPRLQTEAWVTEIVRPIRITAQVAVGIMASTIRFAEAGQAGEVIRPANTGFGVSYALPIIVSGLLTQPGDMLMVENPEAHLHPGGQSKLGRFLAMVAGSGVHVIVETHSDHVLNGARLAVAQDRTLGATDMIAHYFSANDTLAISVNDKGELDHWPAGFFDQIESDLGGLARARRRR